MAGKLPMPSTIQFVDAGSLGSGALGAYDDSNGGTLSLDRSLLSDPELLQSVFNEEMGHHFDALLGGPDAAGDEGAVFSRTLVQGRLNQSELTALKSENDHGIIVVDGKTVAVEFRSEDEGSGNGQSPSSDSGYSGPGSSPGTGGGGPPSTGGGGPPGIGGVGPPGSGGGGPPGTGGDDKDAGDNKKAGDGRDVGNTGNAADQERAGTLADNVADSADAAKEHLERSPDMQSNSTGLRGALGYAAGAFGKLFGGLSTAVGFSKGYDEERERGGSKADAVREGFREVALDVDDGIISGAGLTGGVLLGGAIGTATPLGPVGTAVGATGLGLGGAKLADGLYDESVLDDGIDLGVNYVFDTIKNLQN